MKSFWRVAVVVLLASVVFMMAASAELSVFECKKYGFSMKIPKEFKLTGEDKTMTWTYQPGADAPAKEEPAASGGEKKKGLGAAVGGLLKNKAKSAEPSAPAETKSELEPALTIYVNWVWMPDVASSTGFETNKKSDQQNIDSPDPDYKELVVMTKNPAYAVDKDLAYRYKEIDKKDPAEIHRWHVKAFGNKSFYTLGFCGNFKQFEKWGPIYEECIKSFKLIPLEGAK